MTKRSSIFATFTIGVLTSITLGCGGSSTSQTGSPDMPATRVNKDVSHNEHTDHGHEHTTNEEGKSDMDKMKESLAKLSDEDRASAEKQHVCPVSGEMLGTMGVPQKVDVSGRQVWICCSGCKDKLLKEPEKYLAKLQK